ncbi:uncharacterized protein K444DRAFT_617695 [Hyaloscypha bicolor E]|uniref:Uncharacterized protein n=1 Tax=Hyaloscypha bicolor E TaxID=1095630 RepID=A0A2J6SWT2_9HELO|nr:uncharacterized protein K444DRAFT_617695 [Hyaloscypha bicolor E]PMD55232.1 hypothetical protein K444DRAFT_617695 [Hyaloscypha bicolor E]
MALSAIHDALPLTPMSPTAGQSLISSPTTSFLPLSTPWPLIGECSSLFVSQTSLSGLYAFDPYLPTQSAIQCLPPEATAWWDQFTAPGATPTVLGGVSLVCPQAYTTAATSVIDSSSTLVGCCPLSYDFVAWNSAAADPNPTQCRSALPTQKAVTYIEHAAAADSWSTSSAVVSEVWAFHINGYLVAPASTSTPQTTETQIMKPPTTTKGSSPSPASAMSSSSTTASTPLDGGTPFGRATIIGLALGLGFITVCTIIAAIRSFLAKRFRARQERPPNQDAMIGVLYPELKDDPPAMVTPENFEMSPRRMRRELYPAEFGGVRMVA